MEKLWPLPVGDKACLAEFFALQYSRGRAWRSAYQALLQQRLRDWRSEDHGLSRAPTEEELAQAAEHLASETETLRRMLSQLPSSRGKQEERPDRGKELSWPSAFLYS